MDDDSIKFTGEYTNWSSSPSAAEDPERVQLGDMELWVDTETGDLNLEIKKPDYLAKHGKRYMSVSICSLQVGELRKLLNERTEG